MNSAFLMSLKPDLQRRHAKYFGKIKPGTKIGSFCQYQNNRHRTLDVYGTFVISFPCTNLAMVHRLRHGNVCLSLSRRM